MATRRGNRPRMTKQQLGKFKTAIERCEGHVAPPLTEAQLSKQNTVHVEQDDGSYKSEMIKVSHEPRSNIVMVEQDDGSYKPTRRKNYA